MKNKHYSRKYTEQMYWACLTSTIMLVEILLIVTFFPVIEAAKNFVYLILSVPTAIIAMKTWKLRKLLKRHEVYKSNTSYLSSVSHAEKEKHSAAIKR